MTSLSIRLEARSADHRCYRAYEIDVATDLFGAWLVDMSYGRIGTIGRSKIRSFATIEDAQDQVRACLRKRARAPRRIGVAYHVRRVDRSESWREPGSTIDFAGGFRRWPTQLRQAALLARGIRHMRRSTFVVLLEIWMSSGAESRTWAGIGRWSRPITLVVHAPVVVEGNDRRLLSFLTPTSVRNGSVGSLSFIRGSHHFARAWPTAMRVPIVPNNMVKNGLPEFIAPYHSLLTGC